MSDLAMKLGPTPWQIVQRFGKECLLQAKECPIVFVDVGARIGQWTRLGTANKWQTIAIEASKSSYQGLCEKFRSYQNVEVLNYAVSDRSSHAVRFYTSAEAPGRSSLDPNDVVLSESIFELVEMRTIGEILRERGLRANIIKTDIEGADLLALRGVGLSDPEAQPEIMVSEVSGRCLDFGYVTRDMVEELRTLGYECFIVVTENLQAMLA
jgi:FkbM family methyltransferase